MIIIAFAVLDTIHPNLKGTEQTGEKSQEQEEGGVGGEMEEQVIGEVWESQDEEMAAEGEEEESEGKFVSWE